MRSRLTIDDMRRRTREAAEARLMETRRIVLEEDDGAFQIAARHSDDLRFCPPPLRLSDLPLDALSEVLSRLPSLRDLVLAARTCRTLREAAAITRLRLRVIDLGGLDRPQSEAMLRELSSRGHVDRWAASLTVVRAGERLDCTYGDDMAFAVWGNAIRREQSPPEELLSLLASERLLPNLTQLVYYKCDRSDIWRLPSRITHFKSVESRTPIDFSHLVEGFISDAARAPPDNLPKRFLRLNPDGETFAVLDPSSLGDAADADPSLTAVMPHEITVVRADNGAVLRRLSFARNAVERVRPDSGFQFGLPAAFERSEARRRAYYTCKSFGLDVQVAKYQLHSPTRVDYSKRILRDHVEIVYTMHFRDEHRNCCVPPDGQFEY